MRLVGVSHPIQDARGKAAGRARYAADLSLPHMAHVAMVFSTIPHGYVTAVDDSEALAVESPDGTAGTAYVNVLAVKDGREKDESILKLVEVLKSSEVRQFIEEKYEGGVVPVD